MNLSQPFAIISSLKHYKELKETLTKMEFRFKPVLGCYKGETESSILVAIDTPSDLNTLLDVAKFHDQESILHVDANRAGVLMFVDGATKEVGQWTMITHNRGKTLPCSTYDSDTDTFYACLGGEEQ